MVMVVDEEGAERRQSASVRIQGVKRCFRVGADPKRISTPPPPFSLAGRLKRKEKQSPDCFVNRSIVW